MVNKKYAVERNRISPLIRRQRKDYGDLPSLVKRKVEVPADATLEVKLAAEELSKNFDYVVHFFKKDGKEVAYVFSLEGGYLNPDLNPANAIARLNFYDYKKKLKAKNLDARERSRLLDLLDRYNPVPGGYYPVTLLYSGSWDKKRIDKAGDFRSGFLDARGIKYCFDLGEINELLAEPPESSKAGGGRIESSKPQEVAVP